MQLHLPVVIDLMEAALVLAIGANEPDPRPAAGQHGVRPPAPRKRRIFGR
jgi:hypothetical protein